MKIKKIPLRMCLGCQIMKPKKELIRIVKTSDNNIYIDNFGKMSGRGAYICKTIECMTNARKFHRFEKSFEMKINDEIFDLIKKELEGIDAK